MERASALYALRTRVSSARVDNSFKSGSILTLYRPAMPFGNRKFYFRGSFQFIIVTIQKNINPLETWNLIILVFSKA